MKKGNLHKTALLFLLLFSIFNLLADEVKFYDLKTGNGLDENKKIINSVYASYFTALAEDNTVLSDKFLSIKEIEEDKYLKKAFDILNNRNYPDKWKREIAKALYNRDGKKNQLYLVQLITIIDYKRLMYDAQQKIRAKRKNYPELSLKSKIESLDGYYQIDYNSNIYKTKQSIWDEFIKTYPEIFKAYNVPKNTFFDCDKISFLFEQNKMKKIIFHKIKSKRYYNSFFIDNSKSEEYCEVKIEVTINNKSVNVKEFVNDILHKEGIFALSQKESIYRPELENTLNLIYYAPFKYFANGKFFEYYHNGKIAKEIELKDGKSINTSKFYEPTGEVYATYEYNEHKRIIDVKYYTKVNNKMVLREQRITPLERHHNYTIMLHEFSYYPDGKVKMENYQRNNKVGYRKDYFEDGTLSSSHQNFNFTLHGISKTFYANGKLSFQRHYINGKQQGVQKRYREDGELFKTTSYIDGLRHGLSKSYNSDIEQSWYTNFDRNYIHGVSELRKYDGQLIQKAEYYLGSTHGEQFSLDHKGNRYEESYYYYGQKIKPDSHPIPQKKLNTSLRNYLTTSYRDVILLGTLTKQLVKNYQGFQDPYGFIYIDEVYNKNGKGIECVSDLKMKVSSPSKECGFFTAPQDNPNLIPENWQKAELTQSVDFQARTNYSPTPYYWYFRNKQRLYLLALDRQWSISNSSPQVFQVSIKLKEITPQSN